MNEITITIPLQITFRLSEPGFEPPEQIHFDSEGKIVEMGSGRRWQCGCTFNGEFVCLAHRDLKAE